MYWVQFDQLTTFSVSDRSLAAAAVCAAAVAGPPAPVDGFLPAEPQAARRAAALSAGAPIMAERRETRPRAKRGSEDGIVVVRHG